MPAASSQSPHVVAGVRVRCRHHLSQELRGEAREAIQEEGRRHDHGGGDEEGEREAAARVQNDEGASWP